MANFLQKFSKTNFSKNTQDLLQINRIVKIFVSFTGVLHIARKID